VRGNVIHIAPRTHEIEENYLGHILLVGKFNDIHEGVEVSDLYDKRHQIILQALLDLRDSGEEANIITLISYLENRGYDKEASPAAAIESSYIAGLTRGLPTALNVPYIIKEIRRYSALRMLMKSSEDTMDKVAADIRNNEEVQQIANELIACCHDAIDKSGEANSQRAKMMSEILPPYIEEIRARKQSLESDETQGVVSAPQTGLNSIDGYIDEGLQRGQYSIIAARTGIGKTSLGLTIAINVAQAGYPVMLVTMEMPVEDLVTRIMSMSTGATYKQIVRGEISDRSMELIIQTGERLRPTCLSMQSLTHADPTMIAASIEQFNRRYAYRHPEGLALVVVDYIQQLNPPPRRAAYFTETERMSAVSTAIREMAKKHNVHIMAMSQLRREQGYKKHDKPSLSDLRQSGQLEQDAHWVALLSVTEQEENSGWTKICVDIQKHRNGRTGETEAWLFGPRTLFLDHREMPIELRSDRDMQEDMCG